MTKFPSERDLEEARKNLDKIPASRPLAKDASIVDKTKFQLCEKFVIYKNTHKITQRALAKKIGIDEALMSKVLHYNFDEFTTDRLIKYLSALYPDIYFNISVA